MGTDARIDVIPAAWRRTLRRAGRPVLALALVLGGASAAAVVTNAQAADSAPVDATGTGTTALWLSGASLSYADAQAAGHDLGWTSSAYSLPGAGISRGQLDPDGTLLASARRLLPLADAPDVVVLQGGEADNFAAPEPLHDAAARLIDHVRQHTGPDTHIVLVGPIPGADVPDSLRLVNGVLAQVARDKGVAYVDAVAAGWQAGQPSVPGQLAAALAG